VPSTVFKFLDRICAVLSKTGVISPHLEEQILLDEAQRKTGLHDFGKQDFREGLRLLLVSAKEDAAFHSWGRLSFYHFIVDMLSNRLLVQEALKSLDDYKAPLNPPLIITGLARSGTTFLHRLLGQDPANRVLPLWELLKPTSVGAERDRHRLQTELQMRLMAWIAPDLDKKHYIRADTPEECVVLLAASFVSLMYFAMAPLYNYADWYMKQDLVTPYREYRSQLDLLQQAAPNKRLALKAPDHLGALDIIATVIPEAMVIQTHRDPSKCVHSANSLQLSLYGLMVSEVDVERMGRANFDCLSNEMRRSLAYHSSGQNNICHVSYRTLVRDPLACVKNIYSRFGLRFSEEFEKNLIKYVQRNNGRQHGVHQYRKELFGLKDEEIMERFASYVQHFHDYL
jgi:hypothetical protein